MRTEPPLSTPPPMTKPTMAATARPPAAAARLGRPVGALARGLQQFGLGPDDRHDAILELRRRVHRRCGAGQRMPTGVGVMQSGQIGRPQFEHDTPVTRFGWR